MSFLNRISFLPTAEIIGITASQTSFFVARIQATPKSSTILGLDEYPAQGYVLDDKAKNCRVASTFSATKTLMRIHEMALVKTKDIDATLAFELEPLLPYPIENAVFDKIILEQSKQATKLALFSALKDDVQASLDYLQEHAIDPEKVVPKACALAHFCSHAFPENEFEIVIDIDTEETTCLLIHQGKPLFARSLPLGVEQLPPDENISDEFVAELHSYLRELARILLSFDTETKGTVPLLFTGKVVENPAHCELIASFLERQERPAPTSSSMRFKEGIDWDKARAFASAIGAALSISSPKTSVNFRTLGFTPTAFSKRHKQEFVAYFALMALLAIVGFFYGQLILNEQKNTLVQKYSELLVLQEQPIPEDVLNFSTGQIDESLFTIEKKLNEPSDEIALHPDVPRVSDLLVWLSKHPNISLSTEDGTSDQSLKLESLTYAMVKRPEKGKTKERYQVRVDLEFSAPSATMAREFHDALLVPNQFVDPKSELKWSVQRGKFRASFFLKDRTQYPHTQLPGTSHASNQ